MNKQHIQELILKEHYGLLAPEEREELDLLLEYYEDVRAMREAVRSQVPEDEARGAIRQFDLEQSYEKILARRATAITAARKRRMLVAAIAVLVLAAAAAFFLFDTPHTPLPPFVATNEDAVVLKLAGGQVVTLGDSAAQQINLENTVLNNHNRQLKLTPGSGKAGAGWNTLSVPAGKTYEVELIDGTKVWLNSVSKIRFPFSFEEGVREVYIEGEAYFRVATDVNRPFIVHGGVTVVKVLGTEFNINAYLPGRIITSLVNGKVMVHAEGEQAELKPGEEAVTRTGIPIKVMESNPASLGWREGIYYFENSSIPEITAIIERCFGVKTVADNRQVRTRTFRGKLYRQRGLQAFLDQLNETGQVKFYWKNDTLHCQ